MRRPAISGSLATQSGYGQTPNSDPSSSHQSAKSPFYYDSVGCAGECESRGDEVEIIRQHKKISKMKVSLKTLRYYVCW